MRADGIVWASLNLFFHGLAMLQVGGRPWNMTVAGTAGIAHFHSIVHCAASKCLRLQCHDAVLLTEGGIPSRQTANAARATPCTVSSRSYNPPMLQLIYDERPIKFANEEQEQLWRYMNRRCGMGRLEMQQVTDHLVSLWKAIYSTIAALLLQA